MSPPTGKRRISRRSFLLGSALGACAGPSLLAGPLPAGPLPAGPPDRSPRPVLRGDSDPLLRLKRAVRPVEDLIREADLGGRLSYAVADARTGVVLEARGLREQHAPASLTKIITALYGLDALGAGFRFETRLIATGPIANGVLKGDLVLAGGGDPVLDTDMLAGMARALKRAGVQKVEGKFLVYADALPRVRAIDAEQPDHLGYNPAVSGLNLNFNRVHFEWRRGGKGYRIAMDARARRYRPEVAIASVKIVDRALPVYTYSKGPRGDRWTVARQALGKGGSRWLPVRTPALYAGEVFQILARGEGIALPAAQLLDGPPQGADIVVHRSAPLHEILRDLLKYSNNLIAEAVGLTATGARGIEVRDLAGSAAQMSRWLAGTIGGVNAHFADHSGLRPQSRASASDIVRALVHEGAGGVLPGLLKEIALRDRKGRVIRDHPVRVRAKTGTLNFVSNLAGYLQMPDGSSLAFAILASDDARRGAIARDDRENPPGARGWNKRAKRLQQGLIERWAGLYGLE